MKKKVKIAILFLLGFILFPLGHMNTAKAKENKEVLINQINTVENETLTFTATTGGRLEVVVPLAYVSQNGDWYLSVDGGKSSSYSFRFSSYDVMEDTVVYKAYIQEGKYELRFSGGKAVCQINFIIDAINDEVENNDTFDTANMFIINTNKNGQLLYGDSDCFQVTLTERGLIQFEFKRTTDTGGFSYKVYEEESSGNLNLICSGSDNSKSIRFFGNPGKYYVKLLGNSSYDTNYTIRANFTSTINSLHEIENNDVYTTATEIGSNVEYSGNLESGKDVDWYHIKLQNPQLAEVILKTPRQGKSGIYDVTLYKQENGELKEIDNFKSVVNNVMHNTDKTYLSVGDYYIKIKNDSYADKVALSEQDYQIQLSAQEISLSQPKITLEETTFPNVKIISNEFEELVTGMEIYEKVGSGDWSFLQTSYSNECITNVPKLGTQCSYRVRTFYKDDDSGAVVYSDYSNEEIITFPKLKQPTVTVKRTDFNKVTLSFQDLDSRAEDIVIYQKIGNGDWKSVKTVSSTTNSSEITIKTLGKKYSYQIKVRASSFQSDMSKSKSITISSKLAKPTFTVTKKKYYGTLAFYIKATKYEYAQGVEIWSSINGKNWDYKTKLNLSKTKGTYFYNLEKGRKYYIKMRSYRTVNGKKIYSSWTSVKKVTR